MRRIVRALACLGGLVALMGTQLPAAQAQTPARAQAQTPTQPPAPTQSPTPSPTPTPLPAPTPAPTRTGPATGTAVCLTLVSRPVATTTSIRARALRTGCTRPTRVRLAITVARPGPDKTVRRVKKVLRNGRITAFVRCTATPRRYYVVFSDGLGNLVRSKPARLSCATTPTTTPTTPTTPPVAERPRPAVSLTPPPANPGPSPASPADPASPIVILPSPAASPVFPIPSVTTPVPSVTDPAPSVSTPTPPTGGSAVGTAAEEEVVRLTNEARRRNGCGPLVHDPQLRAAALGHSQDMAARNYFSHTSPEGRDPGDRIRAAGFSPISTWGENIALGHPTAAAVVQAWLDSPGHRANILNCRFTHIGVGQAPSARGFYWTQNFAAR